MAAEEQKESAKEDKKNKLGGAYSHYVLFVLVIVYVFNFIDRNILRIFRRI